MNRTIKRVLRGIYLIVDPLNILLYKIFHLDFRPIPPATNRMRVGSRGIGRFMQAGRNCYRPLQAAIGSYFRSTDGRPRVLDFGCGVARTLRYFRQEDFELHACDVDVSAIDYVHAAFPGVSAYPSSYEPPLRYASDHLDIVYAISVWTHLAPGKQIPWLLEMKRILRPGGLALLTTFGPYAYRRGTHQRHITFSYDDLVRTGFQYSEYTEETRSPGAGPSYGVAAHTPGYIRPEWSKYFRVLDVQEGVIDDLLDLVVLQKD